MPFSLDAIDREVVSLLLEDGRISSAEITRRIGHVSERAVRSRIERLIRTGVIRVSAIVNPHEVASPASLQITIHGVIDALFESAASGRSVEIRR